MPLPWGESGSHYPSHMETFRERVLRILGERGMSNRQFAALYAGPHGNVEDARNKIQRWLRQDRPTTPQRKNVAHAERVLKLDVGHLEQTIQRGHRRPDWRPEVEALWRYVRELEDRLDPPNSGRAPQGKP